MTELTPEQMAEEIPSVPDDEGLARLRGQVFELQQWEERKLDLAEQTKEVDERIKELSEQIIPATFDALHMGGFELEDGSGVSVEPFAAVSCLKENRPRMYAWLATVGLEDIVKRHVGVDFGARKKERQGALEMVDLLQRMGLTPAVVMKVEPMTLAKEMRDRLKKGDEIDESVTVFHGRKTVIKPPKKAKEAAQ